MDLREFKNSLPPFHAVIGFDYGLKRLGVAASDPMLMVATAQKTILRSSWEKDMEAILALVNAKEAGGIIYGLPLQMNGEEGETAAAVRRFAEKVAENITLPYAFWDERLSSKAMENFLIKEVDMSRAKRKNILDSSSAAYILQGALDAMRYL